MGQAFLRLPPFPGHRAHPLIHGGSEVSRETVTAPELKQLLRQHRVGGSFWAAQPHVPEGRDILLAPSSHHQADEMLGAARGQEILHRCVMLKPGRGAFGKLAREVPTLAGSADPWHLAEAAVEVWAGADQELVLVAAIAQCEVRVWGQGRFADCASDEGLVDVVRREVGSHSFRSPYTGEPIGPAEAVALLGSWRRQIDSNRGIAAVLGVAGWKRPTVDPLLWDGANGPRHARRLPEDGQAQVIAWKSRTSASQLHLIEISRHQVAEIEDGMIRGPGLGANCIPPLSVVIDRSGIYFDPSRPSDLERILASADMDDELLGRAARLRQRIVASGISKYGSGRATERKASGKRQILVIGQVEDDRSILSGGGGQTNLELIERARALEPDAWLIYRPHPDVEAGHRRGHIPDDLAQRFVDEVDRSGLISSLIKAVDDVHCITSLAGFEALLRGKSVTTHGVPFYAGWGLTRDLGQIPSRRNRRRSLDELVAATLILYPRYIDPVTRLPCPPEIVIERIAHGEAIVSAPWSGLRKLQGKLNLAARRLREMAA